MTDLDPGGRTRGAAVEIARQAAADDAPAQEPPAEPSGWDVATLPDETAHPDEELQARVDKLLDAANSASGHVRNVYLTFLLFGLYLAIIFGATTHEQLLRAGPVTLPLLNVELPLLGFYWVAPVLFVLLHLNLLLQLMMLAGTLHRLKVIDQIADDEQKKDERSKLFPFPFTQMLAGRTGDRITRWLVRFIVWTTVVVLPVLVLLFGQARFLPYHNAATTWCHRALVVLDLAFLWFLWPIATDFSGRWSSRLQAWWRLVRRRATASGLDRSLPVAIFVSSCSRAFDLDRWPAVLSGIVQLPRRIYRRHISRRRTWRPLFLEELSATVVAVSFLLVAVPGEFLAWPTDRLVGERGGLGISRNLVVPETNLVGSWPTREQIQQFGEDLAWQNSGAPPGLLGRDLRYADLFRSIFVRGDFRGANLQGANLSYANLHGVRLHGTNLQGAILWGTNLQGALLLDVDLQGADLQDANLKGTDLYNADLQGARLWRADLQGTDLRSARLWDVSLWQTGLRGASLAGADLQGADLGGADLEGANLWGANLRGANLRGASLQGADLRGAHLWRARLDDKEDLSDRWALADLRTVDVDPIENLGAWIEVATREIAEEGTRSRVAEQLQAALRDDNRPEVPRLPKAWQSAPNVMFEPDDPLPQQLGWGPRKWATKDDYDEDLAKFLGELACGNDATVHVAQGLARRALTDDDRLYAKHLAARLLGDDCPPAAGLPDDLRAGLRRLAGR